MNLIVCLDDKNGMAFNGRRQSRDRLLTEDLLQTVGESCLWMAPESAELFPELPENVRVDADYMNRASGGEYCFCEDERVLARCDCAGSIIVYRWNRVYPADLRFPGEELAKRERRVEREFAGYSHEKITRERYSL